MTRVLQILNIIKFIIISKY